MREHALLVAVGVGLLALVGCAAKGQVVTLDIRAVTPGGEISTKKADGVGVTVTAFEDARSEKSRLGTRHHLWGGESYFDVPGGKPGDVVAQVASDYLKGRGWRAERAKAGTVDGAGAPAVMLSGKILEFSVDANSKFGRTAITVKTKLVVEAKNQADGSTVRMTLNGDGSDRVFWFDPADAQELTNEVLADSLKKLLADTKIENGLLRLK